MSLGLNPGFRLKSTPSAVCIVGDVPPIATTPLPLGCKLIFPLLLDWISILAAPALPLGFSPSFTFSLKSLLPSVVIVGLFPLDILPPIATLPVPFGATVISPLAPSVIVIEPVVVFPVCNLTSLFPFDWKIPVVFAPPLPVLTVPFANNVPSISVLPLEAVTLNLLLVPSLLISKSPLLNTLNLSVPTAVVWPWLVVAAAAIPIDLEDIAVVHLSPSSVPLCEPLAPP